MVKVVQAPPSKSITHRAIMCASLCSGGVSIIENPLLSDDTRRTIECCKELGTNFDFMDNKIKVTGLIRDLKKEVQINVGESGTTCRLITPIVCALSNIDARIYGEGRMHSRPIGELVDALRTLGAEVSYEEKEGFPPLIIKARGLNGGKVFITLEKSSQYLSGLLLASPLARKKVEIEIKGKKAVSWPYVGLTVMTMKKFGVEVDIYERESRNIWVKKDITEINIVEPEKIRFVVKPARYTATTFVVEGDWSNASYLIAAGLFLKDGLKIKGLFKNSLQGDKKIVDILKKMGGDISFEEDGVISRVSKLHGIDIDMKDCPDLVPTVAVVASMACSKTTITGVEHLKIKESDRLMGVAREVSKVGARVEVFDHGLTIEPAKLPVDREIKFSTYSDHRMAMSLSLYELAGIKVNLDNKKCVAKSFPEFFDVWFEIKNSQES